MNILPFATVLAILAFVSFTSKPQLTEEEVRDRITLNKYRSKQ